MLKITQITPSNIADDELAAVMASLAIVAQAIDKFETNIVKTSSWQTAALLEGTGRRQNVNRLQDARIESAWSTATSLTIISLLCAASMCLTLPAFGQSEPEMPLLAPDFRIAANFPAPNTPPPSSATPTRLKVALVVDTTKIEIVIPDGAVVRDVTTGDTLAELPAQSHWLVTSRAPGGFSQVCFTGQLKNASDAQTKLAVGSSYRDVAFYKGAVPNLELTPLPSRSDPKFWLPLQNSKDQQPQSYVLVPALADGTFGIGGRLYRGALVIRPHSASKVNGVDLVNNIELEDYLLSVVPSEMPSLWPIEALKAQAIAARSYALANVGKHACDGYDIKATVDDQAYTGVAAEHPQTNRAVHETTGQALSHEGKVVSAFFHSSSGGHTELSENVWCRPLPYLRAVPDYDDDSPHFAWTRTANVATAEKALAKCGKGVGSLLSVSTLSRGVSPRVRLLLITGSDRSVFITGEDARRVFGLPSSCFNVGPASDSYVFAGRGYGHGLGMSQWGAKKLAEIGYTALEILSYYYKDVTLNQF